MNAPRCRIRINNDRGTLEYCNGLAVSIWRGEFITPVCEQCEAIIVDCAKGGAVSAVFEAIER